MVVINVFITTGAPHIRTLQQLFLLSNLATVFWLNHIIFVMRKSNALDANKRSSKLHTAVSVAFSYLRQCRVKTGKRMLLFKVFQGIQKKGEELRDRPIGN